MELSQSAARALLRLRPSLHVSSTYRAQSSSSSSLATLVRRNFSTTRSQSDDQSRALNQFLDNNKPETPSDAAPITGGASQPNAEDRSLIDDLLSPSLDGSKGVPGVSQHRPSHYASSSAQPRPTRPTTTDTTSRAGSNTTTNNKPSSITDLLNDFTNMPTRQNRSTSGSTNFLNMLDSRPRGPNPVQPLSITLGPSAGRTTNVVQGDTARAFRTLEIKCKQNNVKSDFNRQRYHERPGLKRKRLASQRWRARFKVNFQGTVKMVNKMRKQGW